METITIHWSIAFGLPLIGGFIARWFYTRWQAWAVAVLMSLIGFLMIRFIGRSSNEYTLGVLIGMASLGALLPEICRGVSAAVHAWFSRPRNIFILAAVVAVAGIFASGNEGWLIKAGMYAALAACVFFALRSVLFGFSGGKKRRRG